MENKLIVDIKKHNNVKYELSFQYNVDLINNIKTLEKREWNPELRKWVLDALSLYNLIVLYKGNDTIFFNFQNEDERENFKKKYQKALKANEQKQKAFEESQRKQKEAIELKDKLLSLDKIDFDYSKYLNEGITPYNYQIASAIFSNTLNKVLIAADLGLGKTLIAILGTEIYEDKVKKVLCIVPNNLKFNWVNEIEKFTQQKAFVLDSNKSKMKKTNKYNIDECKYVICNYDYFKSAKFDFKTRFKDNGVDKFDMLICDECHKLKNSKANQVKNIQKYIRPIVGENAFLLSATPQQNAITDLYVNLNILSPLDFPSKSKFYTEWCGMKYDPSSFGGWSSISTPDYEKLNKKLQGFMIRLKKSEYLKSLPKVSYQKIYIDMTDEQQKTYQNIEQGFTKIDWNEDKSFKNLENQKNVSFMSVMGDLRQYVATIKLDTVCELIEELNNEGEKVVLFDDYVNPLKKLKSNFSHNSSLYIGETDSFERQRLVDLFQKDDNTLQNLFISLGAGNAGITLTRACHIIKQTLSYVPAINSQAVGRCDRIGQTRPVTVFIPIVKDSIDEYIYEMVLEKQKIISKVIDNEDFVDMSDESSSIVGELMKLYKNKYR